MVSVLPIVLAAIPQYSAPALPSFAVSSATQAWQITSDRRSNPLPQELPFQFYASLVYRDRWKPIGALELQKRTPEGMIATPEALAAFNGRSSAKVNGLDVLYTQNQSRIEFNSSANTNMAAFGYAYWGQVLGQSTWIEASQRMTNLWLANPDSADFITASQTFEPTSDPEAAADSALWYLLIIESGAYEPNPEVQNKIREVILSAPASDTKTILTCLAIQSKLFAGTDTKTLESTLSVVPEPTPTVKNLSRRLWAAAELYKLKKTTLDRLNHATQRLLKTQSLADQSQNPSLPNFGAIGNKPGSLANDAPIAAIALCRTGEILQDPELMDRGVVAMRSCFGLFQILQNRTYNPLIPSLHVALANDSYGEYRHDLYQDWKSFESSEGKIVAAAAFLDMKYGAAYEARPGSWVGIDGIRVEGDQFIDLLSNLKRPFSRSVTLRQEVQNDGTRKDLRNLARKPSIVDADLVSVNPAPIIRVYTGRSVTGVEVFDEKNPFEILMNPGQKQVELAPDQLGFSGIASADQLKNPIKIQLRYKSLNLQKSFYLPLTINFNPQSSDWKTYGQLAARKPYHQDWLTTAYNPQNKIDPNMIGMVVSEPFVKTDDILSFTVKGVDEARIELVDQESQQPLIEFLATCIEPTTVEWDLSLYRSSRVFIRLIDQTQKGYVEVKDIKLNKD